MFIRRLGSCPEIIAGDRSILRELLHPEKNEVAGRYSLAHAVVKPGGRTVPHRLKGSEVYYILEGRGVMHIEGESAEVSPADTVHIPPGAVQFIENPGKEDLVFLCIVDPAWKSEDEEIIGEPFGKG